MTSRMLRKHCVLDAEGQAMLKQAMEDLGLSARAHDRILRVARTISDLEGVPTIQSAHVVEAIGFRSLDRTLWARAARAIAGRFAAEPVPLALLERLPEPCPTLRVYAQPADPAVLAAQQGYADDHRWFSVHRLNATSHFPLLEVPTELAARWSAYGGAVVSGLDLLVHQAVLQVEQMTGCKTAPVGAMRQAGERALVERG